MFKKSNSNVALRTWVETKTNALEDYVGGRAPSLYLVADNDNGKKMIMKITTLKLWNAFWIWGCFFFHLEIANFSKEGKDSNELHVVHTTFHISLFDILSDKITFQKWVHSMHFFAKRWSSMDLYWKILSLIFFYGILRLLCVKLFYLSFWHRIFFGMGFLISLSLQIFNVSMFNANVV